MRMRSGWIGWSLAALTLAVGLRAGEEADAPPVPARIVLPKADMEGGLPLMAALAKRASSRAFADVELTPQQLSNLVWATAGINRPADGHLTYPTARNVQDMVLYVVLKGGAYRYDPVGHALEPVAAGDLRAKTGMQDFVAKAAADLVYVRDLSKYRPDQQDVGRAWAFFHAGTMAQNAGLFAASSGWANVVRGMFKADELAPALGLRDSQQIVITQSIGPAAE